MELVLKKGANRQEIEALRKELKQRMESRKKGKLFDARKHKGTVNVTKDPLYIQEQLRDEWERDFS